MPRQSEQEIEEQLRTQIRFLRRSAQVFDEGDEAEAARLATTIRVLVWDKGQNVSVLTQLGLKGHLWFLDTSRREEPPPGPGFVLHTWDAGLAAVRFGGEEAEFIAPLGDNPPPARAGRSESFRHWWTHSVLTDHEGNEFTREDLVLAMTHKEGGAHVDPKIGAAYAALSRSNSLGWFWGRETSKTDEEATYILTGPVTSGGAPLTSTAEGDERAMRSPVPANVRQVAYELETSIQAQLGDVLDEAKED
jgi:hypothetical protein